MKYDCTYTKKRSENEGTILHFCKSLMEDSWILLSASTFSLLQHVVLVKVYEENLASYIYVTRKGKNILIPF